MAQRQSQFIASGCQSIQSSILWLSIKTPHVKSLAVPENSASPRLGMDAIATAAVM